MQQSCFLNLHCFLINLDQSLCKIKIKNGRQIDTTKQYYECRASHDQPNVKAKASQATHFSTRCTLKKILFYETFTFWLFNRIIIVILGYQPVLNYANNDQFYVQLQRKNLT